MSQKTVLVKLLKALAIAIEEMTDDDLELLLTNKGKFSLSSAKKPKGIYVEPLAENSKTIDSLNNCKDRDEARRVLQSIPTKPALASLAKVLKVHIAKHDRREEIENKIVEFVIGSKLRTEAIQTLNFGGSGSQADS